MKCIINPQKLAMEVAKFSASSSWHLQWKVFQCRISYGFKESTQSFFNTPEHCSRPSLQFSVSVRSLEWAFVKQLIIEQPRVREN